jgi:hypothetical protein|tara:strand:- start:1605 stop:2210 length:606 start_codon:yes stop_codon:yes gene_type:complete
MKIIIHPTYFPNIDLLSQLIKSENILFEISDKYIKQTLRNRTEIHAANGKLILSIPVKYSSSKKEKYKDIKICYNSSWQKIHLKSIESAYRNSPYYDFFEDYFIKFFNKKEKFLIDANIKSIEVIYDILDMKMKYDLTNDYKNKLENYTDYRKLVDSNPDEKMSKINYSQVFQEKNGFISGLSSLDIIFNKGLESLDYINS